MKTYKIKNYKGNLVESLSRFQKNHKGMKIVEAVEDGDDLKIKAEESEKQQVEEAAGVKSVFFVLDDETFYDPIAVCSSLSEAKKIANEYGKKEITPHGTSGDLYIFEVPLDKKILNTKIPNKEIKKVATLSF